MPAGVDIRTLSGSRCYIWAVGVVRNYIFIFQIYSSWCCIWKSVHLWVPCRNLREPQEDLRGSWLCQTHTVQSRGSEGMSPYMPSLYTPPPHPLPGCGGRGGRFCGTLLLIPPPPPPHPLPGCGGRGGRFCGTLLLIPVSLASTAYSELLSG